MEKYTRERLLQEYADGKRDFSNIDLKGADLRDAYLSYVNLSVADLRNTNRQYARDKISAI